MLWSRRFDGLDTLVAERGNALLASAVLLTGSRTAGEDLLQAALERLMRSWGRVTEDRERYLTLSGGPAATRPPAAVQAQPASMVLANAAVASGNISYRIRLTTGSLVYEGAFDPRTDTGYLRCPHDDSVLTEFLVNGTRYIGGEKPLTPLPADKVGGGHEKYSRYGQYPGRYHRLSIYGGSDDVLDTASPDPAALFTALRQADASTRKNPDGSLHFQYRRQQKDGSSVTTGNATLTPEGRISTVTLTVAWQSTAKGRLDRGTYAAKLQLSDYGLVVTAKRPADVVPIS